MNWDNLIERAAERMGKKIDKIYENTEDPIINGNFLWKFNGDVEHIDIDNIKGKGGWVFPDEGGYVLKSFEFFLSEYYISYWNWS